VPDRPEHGPAAPGTAPRVACENIPGRGQGQARQDEPPAFRALYGRVAQRGGELADDWPRPVA
jgi:hypothetical protein